MKYRKSIIRQRSSGVELESGNVVVKAGMNSSCLHRAALNSALFLRRTVPSRLVIARG